MEDAAFFKLLNIWQPSKPPRVWSFVVTLFGDLAQTPGTYLSGTALNAVLDGIGVKPEATRVALHRLRKDGWITSTKDGRKSNYALTAWGLAQCAAANPLIYGPRPATDKAWLVATEPGHSQPDGMIAIAPNLFVSPVHVTDHKALALPMDPEAVIPEWVTEKLCPPELVQASDALYQQLVAFHAVTRATDQFTPLQIVILRAAIVHTWRRLVLRTPQVPDHLFPCSWKGTACGRLVDKALESLPLPNLADLTA